MNQKSFLVITFIFLLSSCSFSTMVIKGKGNIKLKQVDFANLKEWEKDNHDEALNSFLNSCKKFRSLGETRQIGGQIGDITVADFRDVCEIGAVIKGMSSRQAKNFFENWFVPFRVFDKNGDGKGLFTGYYEPELRGSKYKTEVFRYPVYARPKELSNEPYYSRKEIEKGILADRDLELLYVDDKVDLFFMQVQGTGRVILPDGVVVKLAYAGKNNLPYTSIGAYMIDNNIIPKDQASYAGIKSWLKNNPNKLDEVLNVNASFIFFKISDNDSVIGAQGVPLTAHRSLAIDSEIMPYGYPIWVDSSAYKKLLVTQDTGSAIKGAVRGDIFFGRGKKGEDLASKMNNRGGYYILLPTNVVDKFSKRKGSIN